MYVASRGLFNLKPPTVFVPPCIKEDVEKLLDIHRTMGQVELNAEVVALDVGMFHLQIACIMLLHLINRGWWRSHMLLFRQ